MSSSKATLVARLKQQSAIISELLRIGGAPGLSLGVFHDGEVIHTEHFGRKDSDVPESPDDYSMYRVGSEFKIVTVAAVARLVTDGLLEWDAPIRDYLPELRQRSDAFGLEATINDLISNRTGLAMANLYWGQQNGQLLNPKTKFVRIVKDLSLAKPFRSTFIYSQWNFCLLQLIIEAVTGRAFGDFVQETIFEPLSLESATFDLLSDENIVKPHANRDDGTAAKIKTNMFGSSTGMAAGGGGARCCVKDQLKLYIALLAAYEHQTTNNVDTSPDSPFTQLRTIFTPWIRLPDTILDQQAYCLGLYRTKLPGNLSCASLNSALPRERIPVFGKSPLTDEIYHHSSTMPGFMGAMFLVPQTHSGVVVHTNATSRCDTADFAAQLLLAAILDIPPPATHSEILSLAHEVVKIQSSWYTRINAFLASCKTNQPPTHQLPAYAGTYWNAARNFKIVVAANGDEGLHVSIQGMPLTSYDLQPCDGDMFCWPANRESELVDRGMWFIPDPRHHVMRFDTNEKKVLSLVWQHERLMDPEVFEKEDSGVGAKL